MGQYAEFKCAVPSPELLERVAADPLPLGLRAAALERVFQRDLYVDAPDGALRRRGITCRFRIRMDDRRILTVRILTRPGGDLALVAPVTFEAEVPETDVRLALRGASEPARRLHALIDPERLRPRVELETERRQRLARAGWFSPVRFECLYDAVTVSSGGLSRPFFELKIRRLRPGGPSLERLAQAFEQRYELRPSLATKLDRAERLLTALESEALARGIQGGGEVALIAFEHDCIALHGAAGVLRLPVLSGSGEEACRHLMRQCFGSADGQVQLLGTASPSAAGTRPALEVWLARRRGGGLGANLEWWPLGDVVARVGSPALRDPRTLAALTVAARSDLVPEWPAARAARPATAAPLSPPLAAPSPAPTVTTSRTTLSGLREPTLPPQALDPARPAPEQFINTELSWLDFNARVLALAEDPSVPLLARVRFLSIFSSNLDEFFMVRVEGFKRAVAEGSTEPTADGLSPEEQLAVITLRLRPLLARQQRCFRDACLPRLAEHGIRILRAAELDQGQRAFARRYFEEQIFPRLTPQAITQAPGHPFPHLANLRLSLAVLVRDPRTGPVHFVHLKVPAGLPRFVPLPESRQCVPVEDVIRANLAALYPGRRAEAAHAFRVTRSAEIDLDERSATSLLQAIEEETKRRPFGPVVRLEVEAAMPPLVRELLLRELRFEDAGQVGALDPGDIYDAEGLVDLGGLRELADLPIPELQYPAFRGGTPPALRDGRSVFAVLAEQDVLVHHPYDGFDETVERWFDEAADDPDVLAIKLTLYRAGGRSGIVDALVRAAGAGKEVAVFVELKARFDEERNIDWAKKLEQAGIHVVYGLVRLKTHAKTALVARREQGGAVVRRYVHIGTGNYNAATARAYSDLGLLSADEALGADLNDLFNELTGASRPPQTPSRRLLVAPTFMLPRLLELTAREAVHARAGRGGRIRLKVNGLADSEMIAALYRAAQAGVAIDVIVRGICALRPGVPGLSERVRVVSILGRFLEHGRIFTFANGGDPEYYIGSADWRPRNLRRRVEVVTPVNDPACRARLDRILEAELADPTAWELGPDGHWTRRAGDGPSAQERFMQATG